MIRILATFAAVCALYGLLLSLNVVCHGIESYIKHGYGLWAVSVFGIYAAACGWAAWCAVVRLDEKQ